MNTRQWMAGALCCAALMMQPIAHAQMGAGKMAEAGKPIPPAEAFTAVLTTMESQIVSAADAMPADKYDFVPTASGDFKGVSSFASQVKHLAAANFSFFKGWGVPGEQDPKAIMQLKSKDEIMKALRDSYAFAHAAVNTITPENAFLSLPAPEERKATRASTAAFAMAHSMDHYGQLVEYLRMNGIIPPASRR
ncbi:DinB family protein [Silvibacterium acidisoli]|uniref:DinB family protein n=1 Tax=Acidobacteriaceae bacterium ZG23-2 TaxID=2883246 RepID=UPI00406CD53D